MKPSTTAPRALIACLFAVLTAASTGFAQSSTPGSSMAPFFGNHKSFAAKAEMDVKGTPQGDMTMELNFLMLEGNMRTEMDMGQMKNDKMPAAAMDQMKKMGMDKMTFISRPDKKITVLIYPGLQAYAETPMTDAQLAEAASTNKIEKTSLGKETIDGHPCEKNKLVTTDNEGKKHEALVWNASDLKDFPVQMQMSEQGATILTKYKEIKLEKPDAKLFEAPIGFKKYNGMQEMVQSEMMKRMDATGMPKK